jgi:branched-chain amino acid transport system ATP-binding protein
MLEVQGLTAGYGDLVVVRDVSFSVPTGEIMAVIGPNGAGKSTLLWVLSGLIVPRAGRVVLDGEDITGWPSHRLLDVGISHVVQGTLVFAELSVEDNLVLGLYGLRSGITRLKDRQLHRVLEYFPILREKRRRPAGSLSGGEKQMLAIGRALMSRPRLLLLDEPSTGLAPLLVEHVFEILRQLKEESSLSELLVEQHADAALRLADRGLVLAQGQIVLQGEARSLMDAEKIKQIYLGTTHRASERE